MKGILRITLFPVYTDTKRRGTLQGTGVDELAPVHWLTHTLNKINNHAKVGELNRVTSTRNTKPSLEGYSSHLMIEEIVFKTPRDK